MVPDDESVAGAERSGFEAAIRIAVHGPLSAPILIVDGCGAGGVWRVVPIARPGVEFAHTGGWRHLDANLAESPVFAGICRLVPDDVLALEVQRNLFAGCFEIGG